MAFTLTPLLIHSEAVPTEAREALKSAGLAAPEQRDAVLESAAKILFRETDLDCEEVRELVGLPWLQNCG